MILKLDAAGRPITWISREEGALHYYRGQVAWEAGIDFVRLRGGVSRATGKLWFLGNREILSDQMDFLKSHASKRARLLSVPIETERPWQLAEGACPLRF